MMPLIREWHFSFPADIPVTISFPPSFPPSSIALYCTNGWEGNAPRTIEKTLKASLFPGTVFSITWRALEARSSSQKTRMIQQDDSRHADIAVLGVPPQQILPALFDAKKRWARTVILTNCMLPGESAPVWLQIMHFCKVHGIIPIGPESIGVVIPRMHFNASLLEEPPKAGTVALLAQTAATMQNAAHFLHAHGIGASILIHSGLSEPASWIDWLADDEKTQLIALELQEVAELRKVLSAMRSAARNKTIVVLAPAKKDPLSPDAAGSCRTDTFSTLATRRAFERCGAVVVDSLDELLAFIQVHSAFRNVHGNRLALLADSPISAHALAAEALQSGLSLPRLAGETLRALSEAPGIGKPISVPLLISPASSISQVQSLFIKILNDPGIDAAILLANSELFHRFNHLGVSSQQINGKPAIVLSWLSTDLECWSSYRLTFAGLAALARLRSVQDACFSSDRLAPELSGSAIKAVQAESHCMLDNGVFLLNETESLQLLGLAGILKKRHLFFAKTTSDALSLADKLGYPVDAKLIAPGSGKCFQQVRIPDADAFSAFAAYARLALKKNYPMALFQGFSITGNDAANSPRIHISLEASFSGRLLRIDKPCQAAEFLPLTENCSLLLASRCGLKNIQRISFSHLLLSLSSLFESVPEIVGGQFSVAFPDVGVIASARLRVAPCLASDAPSFAESFAFPVISRQEWTFPVKKASLKIRLLRPEDNNALRALFSRMSKESVFRRFHFSISSLTEKQASLFSNIDPDRELAFGVFSSSGVICAVGRARRSVSKKLPGTAEFAVAVEDAWQRRGIATGLLHELERHLSSIGCRTLYGEVLASNAPMCALMSKLGFKLINRTSSLGVLAYKKNIPESAHEFCH